MKKQRLTEGNNPLKSESVNLLADKNRENMENMIERTKSEKKLNKPTSIIGAVQS